MSKSDSEKEWETVMQKKIFKRKLHALAFALTLTLSAFMLSANTVHAQTVEGYKAGATSAAGVFLKEPDGQGNRQVSLSVKAIDPTDCANTFASDGFWDRICQKITKDSAGAQNFVGTLAPVKGNSVLEGRVSRPNGDFPFLLSVLLRGDGTVLAVNTMQLDGSELSSVLFTDSRADIETVTAQTSAIEAKLISPSVEASIELGEVNSNTERSTTLNFRYKGGDCSLAIGETASWIRLCETSAKDGPRSYKGNLKPLSTDSRAFVGVLKPDGDGRSFNVIVSQIRENYAVVGLRESSLNFASSNMPENIIFDSTTELSSGGEVNLSANDWRVETESIAELGANIEINFQKISEDAYTGNMSFWFPPNTNSYCPNTSAMLKICESVDKDGPLPMILGIDRLQQSVKFGFSGTASVPPGNGVRWDTFGFDIRQGSSIGDWGDEEADSLYIRFRTLEVSPGTEPVGWLKIVPLDRPRQKIDGNRKLVSTNSPPPAPAAASNGPANIGKNYVLEAETEKACRTDLDKAYQRAKAIDGSHVRMTKQDWDAMLDNFYETIQSDIDRFAQSGANNLKQHCQNAQGTIEAWINNTNFAPQPTNPAQTSEKPAECTRLDQVIASLRAANGIRSDGSIIENWDGHLRFVDQFLRSLPPDPRGTGQSCVKGLEVVVALLDQLNLDQPTTPLITPSNNQSGQTQAQPNGGTFCETLARAYSQIGSIDEQNRAREVLINDNRFGTWKLPSSELSCQLAGELFAQNKIKGF